MSPHLVPGLGRVVMVVPTYNEAAQPRPARRHGCGPPSRRSTSSSSTTTHPTAPASSPTPSRPPTRQVSVLHRSAKEGLGAAYLARLPRSPWTAATTSSARWTPTAPTSPSSCTGCSTRCADADLVIGSRWVPGGSIVNWPRHRELLSRGGNFYTRHAARHPGARRDGRLPPVPAYDAGADRPRRGRVPRLRASRPTWPSGRLRAGLRVVEVPIEFVERERGDSKMSRQVATESLRRITRWGLRERARQRPDALARATAGSTPEQPPAAGR